LPSLKDELLNVWNEQHRISSSALTPLLPVGAEGALAQHPGPYTAANATPRTQPLQGSGKISLSPACTKRVVGGGSGLGKRRRAGRDCLCHKTNSSAACFVSACYIP